MQKIIGVTELQRRFRSVFDEVARKKTPIILTRGSRPEAALIPYEDYLRFQALRETETLARFDQVWQRLAELNTDFSDAEVAADIEAAREELGEKVIILGHHYQREDVIAHADLTGDSYQLSVMASQTDADFIVFCGVHFMAESADILGKPQQRVILPDLGAGCSMAAIGKSTVALALAWIAAASTLAQQPAEWTALQPPLRIWGNTYFVGTRGLSAILVTSDQGHVLIVPNEHFENIYDLSIELLSKVHALSRDIALAMKAAYECDGITLRQHNEPAGDQKIWHYHLHVIARYHEDDFQNSHKVPFPPALRTEYARKLRGWLRKHKESINE